MHNLWKCVFSVAIFFPFAYRRTRGLIQEKILLDREFRDNNMSFVTKEDEYELVLRSILMSRSKEGSTIGEIRGTFFAAIRLKIL